MNNKKLPKFVKLHDIALRLDGDYYVRDAGNWAVRYKRVDNKLKSIFNYNEGGGLSHLHNVPLIEITKKEWMEDNKGYINDDINQKPSPNLKEFIDKIDHLCFEYGYHIYPTINGYESPIAGKYRTFAIIGNDEKIELTYIDGDGCTELWD